MDDRKPTLSPGYTVEKFDNEILLYTEAGTKGVYLSEAAYTIWQLCKEDMTVGQIIEYLEQTYPEQKNQIRQDVLTAIETLKMNNIIDLSNDE